MPSIQDLVKEIQLSSDGKTFVYTKNGSGISEQELEKRFPGLANVIRKAWESAKEGKAVGTDKKTKSQDGTGWQTVRRSKARSPSPELAQYQAPLAGPSSRLQLGDGNRFAPLDVDKYGNDEGEDDVIEVLSSPLPSIGSVYSDDEDDADPYVPLKKSKKRAVAESTKKDLQQPKEKKQKKVGKKAEGQGGSGMGEGGKSTKSGRTIYDLDDDEDVKLYARVAIDVIESTGQLPRDDGHWQEMIDERRGLLPAQLHDVRLVTCDYANAATRLAMAPYNLFRILKKLAPVLPGLDDRMQRLSCGTISLSISGQTANKVCTLGLMQLIISSILTDRLLLRRGHVFPDGHSYTQSLPPSVFGPDAIFKYLVSSQVRFDVVSYTDAACTPERRLAAEKCMADVTKTVTRFDTIAMLVLARTGVVFSRDSHPNGFMKVHQRVLGQKEHRAFVVNGRSQSHMDPALVGSELRAANEELLSSKYCADPRIVHGLGLGLGGRGDEDEDDPWFAELESLLQESTQRLSANAATLAARGNAAGCYHKGCSLHASTAGGRHRMSIMLPCLIDVRMPGAVSLADVRYSCP